jgi:hypothetical protein
LSFFFPRPSKNPWWRFVLGTLHSAGRLTGREEHPPGRPFYLATGTGARFGDSLTWPMVWFPLGVTSFRRILVAECERGRIRGVLRN